MHEFPTLVKNLHVEVILSFVVLVVVVLVVFVVEEDVAKAEHSMREFPTLVKNLYARARVVTISGADGIYSGSSSR